MAKQGVRVIVDLSSGVDLFPTLRLIDNDAAKYAASMATVNALLATMESLGLQDLVLSWHRVPENNFSPEQTMAAFAATFAQLLATASKGTQRVCAFACVCVVACVVSDSSGGGLLVATGGITLHLRHSLKSPLGSVEETATWLVTHKLADIRVSPSIGHLVAQGVDPATAASDVQVCCQHFGGGGVTHVVHPFSHVLWLSLLLC